MLIAWNYPAPGYETSIYTATPLVFWIAVAVCLISGVALINRHLSFNHNEGGSGFPIIPLLLIFFSFAAILSLSIIRSYIAWSGDPLTHIGSINYIIDTGHLESNNFYPIVHEYVALFNIICGISVLKLSMLSPLIFALLSVVFTYIFAKTVFSEKGQIILATILSMTFLGGWFLDLTPNGLANLALPLALFLFVKLLTSDQLQWKILFIIIVFLFPVFHPLPAFALFLVLLTLPLAHRIYLKQKNNLGTAGQDAVFHFNSGIGIILFVWTTFWLSSFTVYSDEIEQIYNHITQGAQSPLGALVGQIKYAAGYNYNVLEMFIKTYGGLLILSIFTIIALVTLWIKRPASSLLLFLFVVPLMIISIILTTFYLVDFGFSPMRLIYYVVSISSLFTAYVLFEIIKPKIKKYPRFKIKFILAVMTTLILGLFLLGGLKIYPSRYILSPNTQITKTDINGMDWFIYKTNPAKNYTSFQVTLYVFRFTDLILNPQEKVDGKYYYYTDAANYYRVKYQLPYHFGYDQNTNLGQYYNHDLYLILNEADRKLYQDVYPEMAPIRFETRDFTQLENDTSINRLYGNGSLTTYYIHGLDVAQ